MNKVKSGKAILPPHLNQDIALNSLIDDVIKNDTDITIDMFTKFLRKTFGVSAELKNEL